MEAVNITLCNKLNRVDSQTGLDVWYKTVLKNCEYKIDTISSVVNTQTSIGQVFNILIPFDERYLPYSEWKDCQDRPEHFTLNIGDILFIDKLIEDAITPNNILTLKNNNKTIACEIRSIMEVPNRNCNKYQFKVSGV